MPLPSADRRSLVLGLLAAVAGLAVYGFDNHLKDPIEEGSGLKLALQAVELLVMGPGLGILVANLHRNHLLREREAARRLADERGQRFVFLGRIAASVAHEIRNPLHHLRLIGEAMSEEPRTSDPALLARLAANLDRLDQAVALVYQLARPAGRADQGDLESIELTGLLAEVIGHLDDRQVPIVVSISEPVRVAGRAGSLRTILANLLRNAVEASRAGCPGPVEITARTTTAAVAIRIANPGTFPVEVLAGGHATGSDKPMGMGVGIGIARHLLERMGGTLDLANHHQTAVATITVPRRRGGPDDQSIRAGGR